MSIKGQMVNGKFVDEYGMVHKFVPKGAEIMDTNNKPTPEPATEPAPVPTEQETKPEWVSDPVLPTAQPVQPAEYLPRCISIEVREAVQDARMAQVIVRAHCKGQYADAVVHYDFEVCEQQQRLECSQSPAAKEGNGNYQSTNLSLQMLKFRQTALITAQAEAIRIAKDILYEQHRDDRDIEELQW
jgi:hypothetical protein